MRADGPALVTARLRELHPDPEGEACLARILARDRTVIPLLADTFLGYVPEETRECDERPEVLADVDDAAALAALESLVADMEASPSLQAAQRELEEEEARDKMDGSP